MPMIDFTVPRQALDEGSASLLVGQLTDILLYWEGADRENKAAQSIAWGIVHFADTFTVGGHPTDKPVYRIEVTVPQWALTGQAKAGLVKELTEAVLEREGSPLDAQNAARVWCLIREVTDGNWGGGGRIFRLEDIGALVLGSPEAGEVYASKRKGAAEDSRSAAQ